MTTTAILFGYLAVGAFLFWALDRLHKVLAPDEYVDPKNTRNIDIMFISYTLMWPFLTPIVLYRILKDSEVQISVMFLNLIDRVFNSIKNLLS